uniref:DUF742 domain-containing protein n=1 Tax=Nocardiopsis lucentensis TaxID=53441 RepID=UPI00035D0F32|nr:DUF742 domain-containing protein [Nocardiopsis lucentensis]
MSAETSRAGIGDGHRLPDPDIGSVPVPEVDVPRAPEPDVPDTARPDPDGAWDGRERFLRPFAVDAGDPDAAGSCGIARGRGMDLLGHVVAARTPGRREWLRPERGAILEHARYARLPVGQVRVIVADMVDDGSLQLCGPSRPLAHQDILHAVLVGLRSL